MRWSSLIAVCLQSTLLAVTINLSQHAGSGSYNASSAVLLTEVLKLVLSIILASREIRLSAAPGYQKLGQDGFEERPEQSGADSDVDDNGPARGPPGLLVTLWCAVFSREVYKMAIPASLFLVQNMLIYVAARNLSIATFQITFQLKTVITAVCAVIMLKRRYNIVQWAALSCLGLGVACIQLESHSKGAETQTGSHTTGLLAVILSCCCSAVAATYFELVVKRPARPTVEPQHSHAVQLTQIDRRQSLEIQQPPYADAVPEETSDGRRTSLVYSIDLETQQHKQTPAVPAAITNSLWIRNIQLSLFSLLLGLPYSWYQRKMAGGEVGYFASFLAGFNAFTWIVIVNQGIGGLLIALVIKYADNVAKGFALAASVCLTFVLSVLFFGVEATVPTVLGTAIVLLATLAFEQHERVRRMGSEVLEWSKGPRTQAVEV